MEAALRWLADANTATAELLRLMDATPVPCGTSAVTAKRSELFGYAGYEYCASHSRRYWGAKLLIICTCDGTVTGFSLANPKLHSERDQARQTLERQPANLGVTNLRMLWRADAADQAVRQVIGDATAWALRQASAGTDGD